MENLRSKYQSIFNTVSGVVGGTLGFALDTLSGMHPLNLAQTLEGGSRSFNNMGFRNDVSDAEGNYIGDRFIHRLTGAFALAASFTAVAMSPELTAPLMSLMPEASTTAINFATMFGMAAIGSNLANAARVVHYYATRPDEAETNFALRPGGTTGF